MKSEIKPLETLWNGNRYRSRLEARWAVFLESLKIDFEYEREGYQTKSGRGYLPDFWLPNVGVRGVAPPGTWLEIKPNEPSGEEMSDLGDVCEFTGASGIIAMGRPPLEMMWGTEWLIQVAVRGEYWWDNSMLIVECVKCGRFKFEFSEGNYMKCPYCGGITDESTVDIALAAEAASLARFEHGERWKTLAERTAAPKQLRGIA